MIEELGVGITLLIALATFVVAAITANLLSKPVLKYYWSRATVKLPSSPEEIMQRLTSVSNESNIVERLYPQIAEAAGRELLPQGLVLLLTLAAEDFGRQYAPPIGGFVVKFIPLWIDALVDQKGFAKYAKDWLKKAEDEVRKEYEANMPARVEPEGPIEDDELFNAVMKIVNIYFEEIKKGDVDELINISPWEDKDVNPFYSQTDSGLFIEYYYGHPSKIWTPWGYFQMCGSVISRGDAPWEKILDSFLERLGATLFIPERQEEYGTVGPVYALHRVDDIELPEPREREKQNYLEYDTAKKAWENMTERVQSAAA